MRHSTHIGVQSPHAMASRQEPRYGSQIANAPKGKFRSAPTHGLPEQRFIGDCAPPCVRQRLNAWCKGESQTTVDPLWYKDAIIYELHVKTFCDSDGDGMGDFRGLIDKLDYLHELGVTAIWLLQFYPA